MALFQVSWYLLRSPQSSLSKRVPKQWGIEHQGSLALMATNDQKSRQLHHQTITENLHHQTITKNRV